ncbi:MAG: LuxR C-terminal-related transcriptional regulator [Pseudooceanicola sp.]
MPEKSETTIVAARAAYAQNAWADATELFLKADRFAPLGTDDLEALVWAAAVAARDAEMLAALEKLYGHHEAAGNHEKCAQAAFWSGLRNMMIGEISLGSGWLQRAGTHAEKTAPGSIQRGYLLLPKVLMHRGKGALDEAIGYADQAIATGQAAGDFDLVALAGSLKGGILFRLGRIKEGYGPIDETMLLATGEKLSPVVTGIVYCEIVSACCRVQEMVRAREWTEVLNEWCRRNPQAKAFNGVCQVHRAEVLQLEGNWAEAYAEAERAGVGLQGTTEQTAMANAAYRRAEIHRLRGALAEADAEYRRADEIGIDPQPGLALLRLAEGRAEEAVTMTRRAIENAGDMPKRAGLLPAGVEILAAAGSFEDAETYCGEMTSIAETFGTEILARVSDHCRGTLALARGDPWAALPVLDRARRYWSIFGAPYLDARLRLDIAKGYLVLGDRDSAETELRAAEKLLVTLGAAPDLDRLRALRGARPAGAASRLTGRECEVLARMAEGLTNRQVAVELGLSPKTVNRHAENIFNKLGVASRAAAVAVAMKSGAI